MFRVKRRSLQKKQQLLLSTSSSATSNIDRFYIISNRYWSCTCTNDQFMNDLVMIRSSVFLAKISSTQIRTPNEPFGVGSVNPTFVPQVTQPHSTMWPFLREVQCKICECLKSKVGRSALFSLPYFPAGFYRNPPLCAKFGFCSHMTNVK